MRRHVPVRGLFIIIALATSSVASATECAQAYTSAQLVGDIGAATQALRSLDEGAFREAGTRMEMNIACIGIPIPTPVVSSAYRFIGGARFLAGEVTEARAWFRVALELDPTFEWDINELPPGHALRETFERERAAGTSEPVAVEGKVLNAPSGAYLLIDGRPLTEASATLNRPHLVQQIGNDDRLVRENFLIQGNDFPPELLGEIPTEPVVTNKKDKRRKGKDEPKEFAYGDFEVERLERVRPPAKTPMLLTGVVGMAASGVVYAVSFNALEEFQKAETSEELYAARSLTNALVVASGSTLAVAVGVGYVGAMLDGSMGLGLGWKF